MIRATGPALAALLAGGCGAPAQRELASEVRREVAERLEAGASLDDDAGADSDEVQRILADGMTADEAVRIALVGSPDVRAGLAALGAQRADLLQASVAPNPRIEAEARLPLEGDGRAFDLAVLQDVTGFLALPAGRRAALAQLDAARLRAVEMAVDRAAETRARFRRVQADERVLGLRRTASEVAGAAYELAQRLYAAGNVTQLEVDLQQVEYEEARLALSAAETALLESRAQLDRLLGVWGGTTGWRVAEPLPDAPEALGVEVDALEARAVERSLTLAAVRREAAAADASLTRARLAGWVPQVAVGAAAEREVEGGWSVGPAVSVGLPFFDRNQGGIARAESLGREAEWRLRARAIDVRSAARAAAVRLRAAHDRAAFLGRVVVPLRQRILERSVLEHNAMAIGIFQLLQARRAEVEAGVRYAETLRDYWAARADVDRLLAGGSPPREAAAPPSLATAPRDVGAPDAPGATP
jgi:cobalt-zinc-cadmium efflux system outer membrane protein